MNTIRLKLDEIGLNLPVPPKAMGNYKAAIKVDNFLFISGQFPLRNGKLIYAGKLGDSLTIEQGYSAAQLCALNLLAQIENIHPYPNKFTIYKLEGYINAKESFDKHAEVLNGASDLLFDVLGKDASHTRIVIGCNSLPLDAAVEISAIIGCSE
jgi:enamine deaminase RidA (YjgF/YER057c/UK114 family)